MVAVTRRMEFSIGRRAIAARTRCGMCSASHLVCSGASIFPMIRVSSRTVFLRKRPFEHPYASGPFNSCLFFEIPAFDEVWPYYLEVLSELIGVAPTE